MKISRHSCLQYLVAAILVFFILSGQEQAFGQDDTRPQVWGLEIEGNEQYSDMVLRDNMATEAPGFFRRLRFWNKEGFDYVEDEVRRDVIRIERYYRRRGYPHASVSYEVEVGKEEWRRAVTFYVQEGPPTVIENLEYVAADNNGFLERLEEDPSFRRSQEQQSLREGQRYQLIRHSDIEGRFLNTLRNMGYVHADVEVAADVDTVENTAAVFINLNPGAVAYFDSIRVTGTQTVPGNYVVREGSIKPGERFSQDKLRAAQREIFSHHLFRFATITVPEQSRDSTVDINVNVREHALRSVRVQGGVGVEELIRADVSWQHRNILGNAHSFTSRARGSFLEQSANVDYLIPYIFNTHSSITISPFVQRLDEQNYQLLRGGINNSFLYQYSQKLAGTIAYEYTRNEEQITGDTEIIEEQLFEDQIYDISAIQLSGYYTTSPDINRYWGWSVRPFAEYSGVFGAGALSYQRFRLDVRRYFNISALQIALRSEGGVLFTDHDENLPNHIRFYSGGTNSVRGWTRRQLGPKRAIMEDEEFQNYVPVGGQSAFNFNVELRQDLRRLISNFGIAAFLDGGQVWREARGFNINELQYGIGGGIRYQSPVGPVRVDLGYKINPTPQDLREFEGADFGPPLNRWAIHFSIGQAF
ncbi:MAG: BamA/TamA family outer membrane protein [Balneolales bacterium]